MFYFVLDVWHQYDCFIEDEKSVTEKVRDYLPGKTRSIKHLEKAFEVFCPDLVDSNKSFLPVDEVVQQLKMLLECMRKMYYVDGRCYTSYKEYTACVSMQYMLDYN